MLKSNLIAAGLLLSACTAMVPSTVVQLMNLSPLTADPEDLAVRIDLPGTVGIREGSARFTIISTYKEETTTYAYVLERQDNVYRIAPEDVDALRALQTRLREQEEAAPRDNSGSLSITAGPCLKSDFAAMDDLVSVGIRTAKDGPFLPLFNNEPLSALFGEVDLSILPICDTP